MPAKTRPYFKPWTTHTGLLIYVQKPAQEGGEWTACIVGTIQKELLSAPTRRAASDYAWTIRDQYEEAAKA